MNIKYLVGTGIVFTIFVAALFYSYLLKLGWLHVATSVLFILSILFTTVKAVISRSGFWILLALALAFAYANKLFRIHTDLTRIFGFNAIALQALYVVVFLITMVVVWPHHISYKETWVLLFGVAILMKLLSIVSDYLFHDITEDYFELFSLFFIISSVICVLKNENRNISPEP